MVCAESWKGRFGAMRCLRRACKLVAPGYTGRRARWLVRRWFLRDRTITIVIDKDVHIKLPAIGALAYAFVVDGDFEKTEREFIQRFLRPGDVFLDVGANAGLYSVLAAKRVGDQGKIHAFEPDPGGFSLLRVNVDLNDVRNVILNRMVVSNDNGVVKFGSCPDAAFSSMRQNAYHQTRGNLEWFEVDSVSLDAYVERQRLERVDLVKVDVEGAELDVLLGASVVLRRTPAPVLMIEFCDVTTAGFGYEANQLPQLLEGYGYQLYHYDPEQQRLLEHHRQVAYDFPTLIATKDAAWVNSRLA